MEDIEKRAFRAYFKRFGKKADQPSQTVEYFESDDGKKQYLSLSNCNGELAIYRILEDGRLRFETLE